MVDQRAPGLVAELPRLVKVGAELLGIVGDVNHTYGYHIPSSRVAASDYSMEGVLNRPAGDFACAIDIGMDWPASREWLKWLIREIRADRIKGIAEVIGSPDGVSARYWSDGATPQWDDPGDPYTGSGHVSWTHVAIYRSTARLDHQLLTGWTPTGRISYGPNQSVRRWSPDDLGDRTATATRPEDGREFIRWGEVLQQKYLCPHEPYSPGWVDHAWRLRMANHPGPGTYEQVRTGSTLIKIPARLGY